MNNNLIKILNKYSKFTDSKISYFNVQQTTDAGIKLSLGILLPNKKSVEIVMDGVVDIKIDNLIDYDIWEAEIEFIDNKYIFSCSAITDEMGVLKIKSNSLVINE